jgi:hypothetical protein
VQNPISFYLDMVDGAAFDQAESGEPVGQYDAPFTPLFVPWLVGVPLLALTPTSSIAWIIIAGLTLAASALCWVAVWRFYMRRVYAHRQQLGTERERPDRRLTALILGATALCLGYAIWRTFSP